MDITQSNAAATPVLGVQHQKQGEELGCAFTVTFSLILFPVNIDIVALLVVKYS